MDRDEIIRMAKEVGWTIGPATLSGLERFASLVAAHEREECAKVCNTADKSTHPADLANSIRARGEK